MAEYDDEIARATEDVESAQEGYDREVKKLGGKAKLLETFGHRTVELSEPFEYCGTTYTEIDMNFRALKGKDLIAISDEMKALKEDASDALNNERYQAKLAARAARIPSDMLLELPAADFGSVTSAARYFLMISG